MSKETLKHKIHEYLSEDDHSKHRWIITTLQTLIILNVVAVILETFESVDHGYGKVFDVFEDITVIVFSIELILRIYISEITHPASSKIKSALKLLTSPSGMIDIVAIVPFFVPFLINIDLRHVRILRLVRLLRVFKFQKYNHSVRIIMKILAEKRVELMGTLVIAISILVVSATLMFYLEREAQPDRFPNIINAFWWGIITLTTIGYGDVVPVTFWGKILGSVVAVSGVLLMAIPLGIISTGFVNKLDEQSRKRRIAHIKSVIKDAFYKKYVPMLGCEIRRGAISIEAIRINLEISDEEIVKIAEGRNEYRYRRLLLPVNGVLAQKMCIEYRDTNTDYGTLFKRSTSDIVCISPDSYNKQSIGYFTYCLAESLHASYISNEFFGAEAEFTDETFGDKGLEPESAFNFVENPYYTTKEKSKIPSSFSRWIYHVRGMSRLSKWIIIADKHRNHTNDDHFIHVRVLGNNSEKVESHFKLLLEQECKKIDNNKLKLDFEYRLRKNHLANYVHHNYPTHNIIYISFPLNLLCYQLFETTAVIKKCIEELKQEGA